MVTRSSSTRLLSRRRGSHTLKKMRMTLLDIPSRRIDFPIQGCCTARARLKQTIWNWETKGKYSGDTGKQCSGFGALRFFEPLGSGSVISCTDPDPSINKQKYLVLWLLVNLWYGSADLDPYQNVTDPKLYLEGQVSSFASNTLHTSTEYIRKPN
jgi:hypothetical protein